MAIYLSEADVERLLPMRECVEAVEEAFRQWGEGRADNRPRARASVRGALLHALAAGSESWGRLAAKVYATTREGARFVVLLFDGRTSELLAVIEAESADLAEHQSLRWMWNELEYGGNYFGDVPEGGYRRLTEAMATGIDVRLGVEVTEVAISAGGMRVRGADGCCSRSLKMTM